MTVINDGCLNRTRWKRWRHQQHTSSCSWEKSRTLACWRRSSTSSYWVTSTIRASLSYWPAGSRARRGLAGCHVNQN